MTTATTTPAALHALLAGLVDYAGLFPPATLAMPEAVAEYARWRSSPERWMLGRFIAPAARLDDLGAALGALPAASRGLPWAVSALVLPPELRWDAKRVGLFNEAHGTLARVDAVETRAATPDAVDEALEVVAPLGVAEVYVELPHAIDRDALDALLARLHAGGARAKLRTGGITPDAFPTAAQVASFIAACQAAGVPFKATAGLHHPLCADYRLTYESDAPLGRMFGFLNVFVAAAAARDGSPEPELAAILGECDAGAFSFDAAGLTWRDHRIDAATVEAARREFAMGFGSCSFAEPVSDLRALKFI